MRVFAYDAHRLGLKPVYRSLVKPETGEALALLVDGVDTEVMSWVLREFRGWLGEEEGKVWVVLGHGRSPYLARAGWPVSPRVAVPGGIRLVFLPPYSPELQPVERVWPLVNEAVANRYFPDLEALMAAVERRWLALQGDRELLKRHTLFHWWPGAKGSG